MAQNQSGYSGAQILSMQKDAMRRVNEMQRQAQEKIKQTQGYIPQNQQEIHSAKHTSNASHNPNAQHTAPTNNANQLKEKIDRCEPEIVQNGFAGILDRLNLDDEKIILIMLIILLVNEGADIMLILALGYILL